MVDVQGVHVVNAAYQVETMLTAEDIVDQLLAIGVADAVTSIAGTSWQSWDRGKIAIWASPSVTAPGNCFLSHCDCGQSCVQSKLVVTCVGPVGRTGSAGVKITRDVVSSAAECPAFVTHTFVTMVVS